MQAFTGFDKAAFKRACKSVIECADPGDTLPILTSVLVRRAGDTLVLVSTDRYRAMRVTITGGVWLDDDGEGDFSMVVRLDVFASMVRQMTAAALKNGPTYRLDFEPERGMLTADLGSESLTFDGCAVDGTYPPVERIMGDPGVTLDAMPTDPRAALTLSPTFLIGLARLMPTKKHPLTLRFVMSGRAVASTWHDGEDARCEHLLMAVTEAETDEANKAEREHAERAARASAKRAAERAAASA